MSGVPSIVSLLACSGLVSVVPMNVVPAGVIGICFFVSSFLCDLAWMRWIALIAWAGELALFVLRTRPAALLLAGVLMLVLLALPGLLLMRSHRAQAGA